MIAYLLDTNVVSELIKSRPDPRAAAWLGSVSDTFISVLTIGELRRGTAALRARDPRRATALDAWIDRLLSEYDDRVLDVTATVATKWARLPRTRTIPVIDSLLAATARVHGLTLATRNLRDVSDLGVPVVDPFAA